MLISKAVIISTSKTDRSETQGVLLGSTPDECAQKAPLGPHAALMEAPRPLYAPLHGSRNKDAGLCCYVHTGVAVTGANILLHSAAGKVLSTPPAGLLGCSPAAQAR